MANTLSKTGIINGQTILPGHVTQSIDALTGTLAYDITISGSLTLTGSVSSLNGFTGNLIGTASVATNAVTANTATSASYALSSSYAVSASQAQLAALATLATNSTYSDNTIITIKNVHTTTIPKGTPCFVTGSGTSGNIAGVVPADASNPDLMPAGVIAGEDLAVGATGVGLLDGFINGVNTSLFQSGDEVFVAVGGGYTNVVPTGSALIQKLGNVEKSAVNGSGVINGPGAVRSVPNITPGYTWVGNSDSVATPAATSSIVGAGSFGTVYPSGSLVGSTASLKFLAGASKTGAGSTVVVTINEIAGRTYGQNLFITATTVEPAAAGAISLQTPVAAPNITFVTANPNTDFTYQIMYI